MSYRDLNRTCCIVGLGSLLVLSANQSLVALDRLVPGAFATIQAAEAASSPGDRIIVSPGTYTTPAGGLLIDVANLQLLSTGGFAGTTIRNNTADEPVIEINAPGVIIGDVGQGFTIEQLTPGPGTTSHNGECCIFIHADQVKFANPVRVQYNRLSGNESEDGIIVTPYIESGGLIIQENGFVRNGGTFAFDNAIFFDYDDYPNTNVGFVSLYDASVDILNNNGTEIDTKAVYFPYSIYSSRVNINGNQFSFVDNATNEFAIETDDIDSLSTLNIIGNTITNVYSGIYLTNLTNGSTCLIQGNTINHYDYGMEFYVENGSDLTISENTISGNGTAGYGIYSGLEYGSEVLVSGNTISGIDSYGIYNSYNSYGANMLISDNTISSATQLDYGISTSTDFGSATTITGNTVSGWDQYGIYERYPSETSTYVVTNNTCTADSAGGDYGIYLDEPISGVVVTINNNSFADFDTTGIYISELDAGATLDCSGNTLTALGAGADYGIFFEDIHDGTTVAADGNSIGGFDVAGIRTDKCYDGGALSFTNNTLTALSTGADYGIYNYSVYSGASMNVTGNTVSGYGNSGGGEAGFFQDYETYDGSILILANNTFTAHAMGSEHGLFTHGLYQGSGGHIVNNTFTGYTYAGMESEFCLDGSLLSVARNTFNPRGDDSDYGIYLADGIDGTSQGNISNNTINGFTESGIWFSDIDNGSRLSCNYNEVNGKATSGANSGIYGNGDVNYHSYIEAIGNTIGNINGNPSRHTGGVFINGGPNNGSEAVICNNFIRGLTGQVSGPPTYFMSGITFFYAADRGSSITICDNNVADFADAQIFFYYRFDEGSKFDIHGNILDGGHFGIWTDEENIGNGTTGSITRNVITGFDADGINLGEVWGSKLDISENKITGNNSANGIIINDTGLNQNGVNSAAQVSISHNCIASVQHGVDIETVLDTAFVDVNQNDFDGVIALGINNSGGGASNTINGENNFFGAVPIKSNGNVDIDPELASPPDADGDGVGDCDDQCFDTAAGDAADAAGCSCIQLNPTGDTDGDGTIDCDDGCPDDPNKTFPGACGCGVADTDANGNGTADCNDVATPDSPCGLCGGGAASMMPFAVLGLTWFSRRRWSRAVNR